MDISSLSPAPVHCDNNTATQLALDDVLHARIMHIKNDMLSKVFGVLSYIPYLYLIN